MTARGCVKSWDIAVTRRIRIKIEIYILKCVEHGKLIGKQKLSWRRMKNSVIFLTRRM